MLSSTLITPPTRAELLTGPIRPVTRRRAESDTSYPQDDVASKRSTKQEPAAGGPTLCTAADWACNYLVLNGKKFSLADYPFYAGIYNQELGEDFSAMLMKTARQIAKSTTQANDQIKSLCLTPHWKELFITPSQEQTMRYVQTRFDAVLHGSPRLQGRWVTPDLASRVFLKQFALSGAGPHRHQHLFQQHHRRLHLDGKRHERFAGRLCRAAAERRYHL